MVAILALTASGVGMGSCPESPGGYCYYYSYYDFTLYNYNLNILLMALHEHPTLYRISLHLLLIGLHYHFRPISLQSVCAVALYMV